MTAPIIAQHDVAFFDLDGVIYLGPIAVPGAVQGIADVRAAGARVMYVTNNAARDEASVAAHLGELGYGASLDDLVTSAQATEDQCTPTQSSQAPRSRSCHTFTFQKKACRRAPKELTRSAVLLSERLRRPVLSV